MTQEVWRSLPRDPRYQVSNLGRVRTFARAKGEKYLKPCTPPSCRYALVSIRGKAVGVHVLVAETFLGPRPEGMCVRHLDDDGLNNRLENIAYGTPKDNASDRERNGRYARGSAVVTAKLTEDLVAQIKCAEGSSRKIAAQYGVGRETVRLIRNGHTWRHVA